MLRHGYDDTNGIVIGGNPSERKCKVYYEDREQHQFYATKDSEAKEKAESWLEQKKQELGQMLFNRIWPDNKWELRIYD